jgi:hypothetical protein
MEIACLVSAGILKIQPAALSGDLIHNSVLTKIRTWSFRAPTKQTHRLTNSTNWPYRMLTLSPMLSTPTSPTHLPLMVLSYKEQTSKKRKLDTELISIVFLKMNTLILCQE